MVHEAYVKLVERRSVDWTERAHFFSIPAQIIRRILINHIRSGAACVGNFPENGQARLEHGRGLAPGDLKITHGDVA